MTYFVEVTPTNHVGGEEKVLINMDQVVKIYPALGVGENVILQTTVGEHLRIKENYSQFKQFAVETVSSTDIAKKVSGMPKVSKKENAPVADIIPLTKEGK